MISNRTSRNPGPESNRKTNASAISIRPIYLLCGGGSRRMGRDKAMLPFGGGTLLEHQIGKCGDAFSEIVLLSGIRQYPVELRHLPDTLEDAGPLSGLLAALEDSVAHPSPVRSSDTLAVMAVDLPAIRTGTVQWLASARLPEGCDAMVAVPDVPDTRHAGEGKTGHLKPAGELETGRPNSSRELKTGNPNPVRQLQPLLGLYRREIRSILRGYLTDGQRPVKGFLAQIRVGTFTVPAPELGNMNTGEDYRHFSR